MVTVSQVGTDSDQATRESLMRSHYDKRLEELISQLHQADSKAVSYHAECRALTKQLEQSNKTRAKLNKEITEANSQISHLQVSLSPHSTVIVCRPILDAFYTAQL